MSLKLGGFVCDNCFIFTTFDGVSTDDLSKMFTKDGKNLGVSNTYQKIKGWKYYNVSEDTHLGSDWIRWNQKSYCLCSKCDRNLKLKKLISKI